MDDHDTAAAAGTWWGEALLPSVKVLAEAVAIKASSMNTTMRRGTGIRRVATGAARVLVLAVAFPRVTIAVGTAAQQRTHVNASVVHLQGKAVVARDTLGSSIRGATGPGASNTICALAHVGFAKYVDAAPSVSLGTQAFVQVDAVDTM